MKILDLSIFNPNNSDYLKTSSINMWLSSNLELVNEAPAEQLLQVFSILAELKIYDSKFIDKLCQALLNKLGFFSYAELTSILRYQYELNYSRNLDLIESIAKRLSQESAPQSIKTLSESIWLLAKLNFRSQEFFDNWKQQIVIQVRTFESNNLIMSIQAIAHLRFYDEQIIDSLLERSESLFESMNNQSKLLSLFYFCMILSNFNSSALLQNKITTFIQRNMSDLDIDSLQDISSKHQLLQIHASKIYQLSPTMFDKLSRETQEQDTITTSITQNKVRTFVANLYYRYEIISEFRDTLTATNIDLKVVRDSTNPSLDVYIQVEGPTHFFINHQPDHREPMLNGATIFRNFIHAQHDIHPFAVTYVGVDDRTYYESLATRLNSFPVEYSTRSSENASAFMQAQTTEEQGESLPIVEEIEVPQVKSRTQKTGKPSKKRVVDHDFDKALKEIGDLAISSSKEVTYESLFSEAKKNKKHHPSVRSLLESALKEANVEKLEIILKHHAEHKLGGLNSSWFIENYVDQLVKRYSLERLTLDRDASRIYVEIYCLFLRYNYKEENLSILHFKALTYSFYYKDVGMFISLLDLFPASPNKTQLMEYFFINCGGLDNVEIADALLLYNIDINIYYSRESVEVLYAISTGLKHNKKELSNEQRTINKVFAALTEFHDSAQPIIEDLLQDSVGGTLDGSHSGKGITALHLSVYKENFLEITSFLLRRGASPNTMNAADMTPLITALSTGNQNAALEILKYNPNLNFKLKEQITAAHIAVAKGFITVVQKIVELGGDISSPLNVPNEFRFINTHNEAIVFSPNETPLFTALKHKYGEIARVLINAGAALDGYILYRIQIFNGGNFISRDPVKHSVLTLSIRNCPELLDLLISKGVKINDENLCPTPLMIAAELSNIATQVRVASTNNYDRLEEVRSKTIEYMDARIFERLLLLGADINQEDDQGDKVIQYTLQPGGSIHTHLIKMLEHAQKHNRDGELLRKKIIEEASSLDISNIYQSLERIKRLVHEIESSNPDNVTSMLTSAPENVSVRNKRLNANRSRKLDGSKRLERLRKLADENQSLSSESLSSIPKIIAPEDSSVGNKQLIDNGDPLQYDSWNLITTNFYSELNLAVDTLRFLNRPTVYNAAKVSYDISLMSITVAGSLVPGLSLVATPSVITKIVSGNYFDAALDAGTNMGFSAISGLFYVMNVPILSELSIQLPSEMNYYRTIMNIASLQEELLDPENRIKSSESYGNLVGSVSASLAYLQSYFDADFGSDYILDCYHLGKCSLIDNVD